MRGTSGRVRQDASVAIGIPEYISRMPVIPFATSTGRALPEASKWTCISHRPGIRNLPVASMTQAPGAGWVFFAMLVIRPSAMATETSTRGSAPVASMTVACWKTMLWENSAADERAPRASCRRDRLFPVQLDVDRRDFAAVEITQPLIVAGHAVEVRFHLIIGVGP